MKREDIIKQLRDCKDAWRYEDENKFLKVYPKPLVAMLDAVFEYVEELEDELRVLKEADNAR